VNSVLILVGTVLVAAGLLNWFLPEDTAPTVVREKTTVSRHVERSRPSVTRDRTSDRPRRAKGSTVARVGTKKVIEDPSDVTTTTDAPLQTRRSETMSIALLGFGFLSLLAGSAWPRLQSVTGPGGVGVTFTSALSGVSDVAAQQEERLKAVEGSVEKLSTTVELLVRQLIQASREG
jgi:hypothetical protein